MSAILDTLVTDRTQEDVLSGNEKGIYGIKDLNRVESAVEYVASLLEQAGYPVTTYPPKSVWKMIDVPTMGEMKRYLTNISNIRKALPVPEGIPEVPEDMVLLTYEEANAIETILFSVGERGEALSAMYLHCNEANCGYDGSDLV